MTTLNNNNFIEYNSLISLSITSEEYENANYTKCLYVEDDLESSLSFKLCKKPLREYYDLMGSFFYIRNIDECISNFGISNDKKKFKKEEKTSKELSFLNKERIHQNNNFYLQHMTSKKFVSIEISQNNYFVLKLFKNIDNAAIFSLRKINEKRNSNSFLTTKEIYYLCINVKEDDQFYYIEDEKKPIRENCDYYNILINKNQITQFLITDQILYVKDLKNIYSGQLINIIFSDIKGNKEEQYMLGVENKIKKFSDIDLNNEEIKDEENTNIEYRIIGVPYKNELNEHVLKNSFWIIEEDLENYDSSNKQPIKVKERIRIKNLDTGLYLSIKRQNNPLKNNISEICDISSFNLENKTFEFILVDEHKLNDNLYLEYNFIFFNYMLDTLSSEITDEGKYLLKGVFTNLKLSFINELEFYYYQSVSLTIKNNYNLLVKNEENDFIFSIKKIDVFQGNQINYIVKIIKILNVEIKENELNNFNAINEIITFFLEYLLNIDYSFRDENYEYNAPMRERQIFLYKFNIIETITNLIDNYLKKIELFENFLTEKRYILTNLLSNIIKFFTFLCTNNEEIKQSIYIIALNKLLEISEKIFNEDFTIIINFIYELINDSEALQDYLLDGGNLLNQQINNNIKLQKYKDNINNLLRKKKLLEYIEKNHNYLLCYEKLIRLNKVQYKRREIMEDVKKHIEEVKKKDNPYIKNYKQIINEVIFEVIKIIKKHAILLERFINKSDGKSKNEYEIKKRRTSYGRKSTIKENIIKKSQDELIRQKKSKLGTILGNNFGYTDSCKINLSTKPFLESSESITNLNNNLINNNEKKNKKINNIFSFSSKSINNDINANDMNKNILISNETSESSRPLIENSNYERLKNHFKRNIELSNIETKKSTKFMNNNLYSSILKNKTKKLEQMKTANGLTFEKNETIKSETIEPYQLYLNKLGKIFLFIKFFVSFDLENSLFIQDNFLFQIFKNGLKTEDFENPLYIFFIGKSYNEKTKSWFFQSNSVVLYLFHLYNMMFPNIKSKLQNKIDKNENISSMDIIEEMENDNVDENYSEIDEVKYKQELKVDFEMLDEYLCILYSIYQFCINQYAKTVYILSKITSNFYFNFTKYNELKQFKLCFVDTLRNLLSKVAFIKNDIIENIFIKTIKTPSLITDEFDLDYINPILNEKINGDKKTKKKNKKKLFSKSEITLIEYVTYLGQKCDKIRYLYEKITIFTYIKRLIDNEKIIFNSKEEFDKVIEQQIPKILDILNKQKKKILRYYEKLNKTKANYSIVRNIKLIGGKNEEDNNNEEGKNDYYEVFQIEKTTEIITKILRKYEIEKFFNNIIYIESNETFMNTDKIIIKIRKLREHLYQIKKEIQILKINLGKDLNISDNKNLFFSESNEKAFLSLNRHLSQICNETGKLFNLNNILVKRKDKLSEILSLENKTFYQKIKFCNSFKNMIDALNYYKGEKDENILIYCSYLLKILSDIKNIDCTFYKKISKYYKLYGSLLHKSFKFISKYSIDKAEVNTQYLFLNISFYGIEGFLFIIKNCKLPFNEIKDFMENIFYELQKIFDKFKNKKYKIIYQILYTYAVNRILLILNKQKNYDSYLYDVFFNSIYPISKMRENISFCVETINKNSYKENIISRKNSNIFLAKDSSLIAKDEDDDETISLIIPDDEKDPLIVQDLRTKIIPMDLSNINLGETKKSKEKITISRLEQNEKTIIDEEFIKWDDEDELNRLSFYLNFLSVYVIYLNDKNSLLEENGNEFMKNKKKNELEKEFSFNILSGKIKSLLDYRYFNDYNLNYIDETNLFMSSQIDDNSLIKEEKKYFGEDLGAKNIDYKFHSLLLESILNYRTKFKRNSIEIQIKKVKAKADEINNEYMKTESQNLEISTINKKNDNNNIDNVMFYYYDPEYIDLILLEKIFNSIELKEDIMDYCIDDYHYEKKNSELLENLLCVKNNYKLIESYDGDEFDLCNNYFIKNNMELLMKKILKSFNSNDLIEIEAMENYSYNKMGEIYLDNNYYKMKNESSEKDKSLVEYLKIIDESKKNRKEKENIDDKEKDELEKEKRKELEEEKNYIEESLNNKIDLITFFNSLIYIYPKYKESICILYYKIGFNLLIENCKDDLFNKDNTDDISKKVDLESITEILLLLFSRKKLRVLIENKNVFPIMLNSIKQLFSYIILKGGRLAFKNIELLKELFHKLDFIFDHLSNDFEKIMKKQTNTKKTGQFIKNTRKLENLLEFLIMFLDLKKAIEENILTEEINKFIGEVVEKVIKLIYILLKLPNRKNVAIIEILIDFLFNFIKGPDIDNLNLLFSLGFYDLVLFVIKDIDYYHLFLNLLSKENMHEAINNVTEVECNIIKIFIIYYNITIGNENINEFEKLQHWYENNFNYIRYKLKKLYYMSEKEMEKREYDINKMLLFMKSNDNDDYTECELKKRGGIFISTAELDTIFEMNSSKYRRMYKKQFNKNEENYCIIKFDLILAYYTLYNYHKDLTTKESEGALCMIKKKNKSVFFWTINFFIDLFFFVKNILFFIFYAIFYIFRRISIKKKNDVDLLQDLTNIDVKSKLIDDQKMINFLRIYIRELEITIKNNIFKIYFPLLDRANIIEEYKEEYYNVEKIDSSEFINYILSNYDTINIRSKQYVMIDKIIKLPLINLLFKNIYIYEILLLIIGLITNLLIILSFSTFTEENCDVINYPNIDSKKIRIQCPHFLYKQKSDEDIEYNDSNLILYFKIFGGIELVFQSLIFIDYLIRIFSVKNALIRFKYKIKELKEGKKDNQMKIIVIIIANCFINFLSLYYILSIVFIILGLIFHPFFHCIILLEFVKRIQLMQTVLKAMYKPLKNILITLLMFIILEYLFSLFAISFFTNHFPNYTDTKNFLKTFMRMIDQTFKQDGGIGTYLDKTLEDNYVAYSAPSYFNLRFFFDLVFFILILLLIFQMFLSTIIDYFNETRENTEEFNEGLETQCIVCGLEREKIEKIYSNDKNAFDKHINYYHNAFNYIYYLMFLQSSNSRDPIIESSIWKLHLSKNLSYLPKDICFKQFEKKCWKKLNQKKNKEDL